MQSTVPYISIIVPCRNEKEYIEVCVRSILSQESPKGGFEVIVADGMSDDGTREILQRLKKEDPRLRIIDNIGRIVSTGLNSAIQMAQGSVIIRMDAHTKYAADYICMCLTVLKETGADNVGGPARTMSSGYIQSAICAAYHSSFSVGGAKFHKRDYEGWVDTVPYGCWPREVFDRVGLFDEELVRNQDDEFNLRLRRSGGKIWQSPRIKSWYKPRRSIKGLINQYAQYGYWKVKVIQKHKIPASIRHLVPAIFVLLFGILPVGALWWSFWGWTWVGLVFIYALCNFFASLNAAINARENGWNVLFLLPIIFLCYHFGYGWGFLRGFFDFVILRRKSQTIFSALPRNPSG